MGENYGCCYTSVLVEGKSLPPISPPPQLQMATPLCTDSWVLMIGTKSEFGVQNPRLGVGVSLGCCYTSYLGEGGSLNPISPSPQHHMATPLCTASWVLMRGPQPEFGVQRPRLGVGVNPLFCSGPFWLENAQVHTVSPPPGQHTSTLLCKASWVLMRGPQPEFGCRIRRHCVVLN